MFIADEDWSKVNPRAAKQVGYSGLIGYVSEDTTGKNWTPAAIWAAHDAGLDVGVVYEYATTSALGGAARGTHDADIATSQARALGFPSGVTIYTAIDFDAQPADMPAIFAYVDAFREGCSREGYKCGVYGGYLVCQLISYKGWGVKLWQTFAWSSGQWCPAASVRQVHNGVHLAGATVDQDQTMVPDWGQWSADGRYPSSTGEEDMSVTTDNVVNAWRQGNPDTVDENGAPISIEPVKWRQRDEAWQANVNSTLASLATAIGKLGAATGGLTDAEASDLHTIASVLKAPVT